jgi:hypothetical protein
MATPTTGMNMEKMIVGIPATVAAAGEISADSIISVFPFFESYAKSIGYTRQRWMTALKPKAHAYHD